MMKVAAAATTVLTDSQAGMNSVLLQSRLAL